MNNSYEARLGTDRMLPLVFRMALPAVMAQLVNLLYNLVDRIYIGHIPDIGTDALAAHRSMAPPIPGTIFPGIVQLAILPSWST